MPSIGDWLNCPLGIIQNLFDQNGSYDSAIIQDFFSKKLQSKKELSWIPSLNDTALHNLRPNSLVRFRCMIQDMYDPEYYLGLYEVENQATGISVLKSGKYKDVAECAPNNTIKLDSPKNKTMERLTLYCVPVPGESEWVKKCHSDVNKTSSMPSTSQPRVYTKRGLEEDTEHTDINMECPSSEGSDQVNETDVKSDAESGPKKLQVQKQGDTVANNTSAGPDLNFPLPGEVGPACLVKVYEGLDSFKVNDVVEFVGVLSVDPSMAQFNGLSEGEELAIDGFEMSQPELDAHVPPPSLVPRLHCVQAQRLTHLSPHIPPLHTEEFRKESASMQSQVEEIRCQLLSVLQHAMLGDSLAAEFLLCHLVSQVYARVDVMPLGKFCVNFSNSPVHTAYSKLLQFLLSNIVTQSHLLPMTLENMNKLKFAPQKDYTSNRLRSGVLQLADHTSLVIDETVLQPGQLDPNGVNNIQSLGTMISWQKVEYDFSFHKQDFLSNVSVLVLSEGKSILPSDSQVPMMYTSLPDDIRSYFAQLDPILTQDFLTKVRTYVAMARHMEYNVTEDVQKVIQDDFVESRKEDPNDMTVDDFHSLLCLVRLLSLTHLKESPTLELWKKGRALERQRKLVLSQQPGRSQS